MATEKKAAPETSSDARNKNTLERLLEVQRLLKAPKNQYNTFGKYKYRSCEDILEALKPILADQGLVLRLYDEIITIGDRVFLKAIAALQSTDAGIVGTIFNTGLAEIATDKKGMDPSQITGTASSYARKYCLNGLFLIDDTKDADTDEHTQAAQVAAENAKKRRDQINATVSDDEKADFKEFLEAHGIEEAFILETCNISDLSNLPKGRYTAFTARKNLETVKANFEKWKNQKKEEKDT